MQKMHKSRYHGLRRWQKWSKMEMMIMIMMIVIMMMMFVMMIIMMMIKTDCTVSNKLASLEQSCEMSNIYTEQIFQN